MSVSKINDIQTNITELTPYFPDEVIYEFTKHINKLSDIHSLSLLNRHFFMVIFNSNFPVWQTLLMHHFPSSFRFVAPHLTSASLYRNFKAIDNNMRTGTYQTLTLAGHQDSVLSLVLQQA